MDSEHISQNMLGFLVDFQNRLRRPLWVFSLSVWSLGDYSSHFVMPLLSSAVHFEVCRVKKVGVPPKCLQDI